MPKDLPRHEPPDPNVPVFNCIIYLKPSANGVQARVANLADLEIQAASEREVLSRLVPLFKSKVAAWHQAGTPIPWLDPPLESMPGEVQRLIPVHL